MVSLPEPHKAASPAVDNSAWKPRSTLLGTLLANRYRITGALGQGSTGAVFRADDVLLKRPVAIRILAPNLAQHAPLIAQIRTRIEDNQQRDQESLVNLVDITDVGMTLEGEVFIASDFLDGDHLSTMLTRGGRLPWGRARSLLIRLGQILHGFHRQGIVVGTLEARHCYAVRAKAKQEAIKIVHNAILEHLAGAIGPGGGHGVAMLARYVAPERICGEPLDARTDVYSLGVIAYELLTGTLPFTDSNPIRLVSMHLQKAPPSPRSVAPDADIPDAVEALLLKCLAKDPNERFPTMEALTDALNAIPESDAATAVAPAASIATAAATVVAPLVATPAPPAPLTASLGPAVPISAPRIPSTPISARASTPIAAPSAPATPVVATPVVATPVVTAPTSPLAAARPASVPATLTESGKLRLPPPPTLGGPRTPSGPSPSAPASARPPTLGLAAALPPPPSLPPAPAPAPAPRAPSIPVPSATLPAGTVPAPATPVSSVRQPSAVVPAAAIVSPIPAPTPPAASPEPPAVADATASAAPVPSAIIAPASATPVPSAVTAPNTTVAAPVPSAILATADVGAAADADPARMRARIAAFAADEVRRKNPLRAVPASAMAETRIGPAPTRPPTPVVDDEPSAPRPAARPIVAAAATPIVAPAAKPVEAPARPVEAASRLQAVQARPAEPALTPAASFSDGQLDEPPRRRGWLIGGIVGLAMAAGIAALVVTSPSFMADRARDNPTKIAAVQGQIPERVVSTPTKIAEAPTPAEPERGTGVVAPDTSPTPDAATPTPDAKPVDPPPDTKPADPAPDTKLDAPPDAKAAAVDPPKKTKKKIRRNFDFEDEEPREKDVFDQLREHMEAKKAAEAARAAAMAGQQPAPTPTPPPAAPAEKPDDRARETLDRARQASSSGNHSLAYTLAKQAYSIGKSLDALELMGVSACRAKNADGARTAVGSLTGTRRNAVMIACTQSGITL